MLWMLLRFDWANLIVAACFMLRGRDRRIDFGRLHCSEDLSTQRFLKFDLHLKKIPKFFGKRVKYQTSSRAWVGLSDFPN